MAQTKAKRTSRAEPQRKAINHLEQKTVIHRASSLCSAPDARNRIGLGYFLDATLTDGADADTRYPGKTLELKLKVRNGDPAEVLPWSGVINIRARDAWAFYRAVELAFEGAAEAGLIPSERLTAANAPK
jgi:hypothetical protein